MVKEFDVIVNTFAIGIWTATSKLDSYHYKAIVDGEEYFYRIINGDRMDGKCKKEAFGRASVEIHYHAKNSGNIVRFQPVTRKSTNRKKKISDKQKELF